MTSEPVTTEAAPGENALHEIEHLLEGLARLARTDVAPRQFYGELVAASVRALAAIAGAVWTPRATGTWQVESHLHLDELELANNPAAQLAHERLLNEAAAADSGMLVPPHFEANADRAQSGGGSVENPSPYLLVLMPIRDEGETTAILEIVARPESSPGTQQGYLRVLSALAEIATDFQQAAQLRELRTARDQWQQLSHFAQQIHTSLDMQTTAYTLANEARRLIGCDRACVLVQGRKLVLQAVSGTETFDPRANFVRRLEALAEAALVTGEALWVEDDPRALAPEIETCVTHGCVTYGEDDPRALAPEIEMPLQAYLDECHSRSVAVLPLAAGETNGERAELLGALVIEQFHAGLPADLRSRAEVVRVHGTTALRNALELERLPLSDTMRRVAAASWWLQARQLPRTLAVSGGLLLLAAILSLWPAELRIAARGELQPAQRRDIFAPLDGVVQRIDLTHGQQVRAGEVLAVLRSPDLELQQRRVEGERQTARKRLEALAAGRLGKRFTTDEELQEYRRLTAEEAEVKAELAGLAAQQIILDRQAAELTVKSPIAGEVLTWDVANLLLARPVARGQSLLLIAAASGPWVLELQLPDERAGHVLAAYRAARAAGRQVPIEYMLATRPGEKLQGHIQTIARSTEADRENRPSVRVTIALDDEQLPELRPGATAVAKIDCGPHALGYVWLHDLIDTVRTWLFF
jgi:multidrug efflux pump subunit AcrA (membrane-fusion protein)